MQGSTRAQLSLYVPPPAGALVDAVRRVVDPVQAALIPAHVTLARDAELGDAAPPLVRSRLAAAALEPLTLRFGAATPFEGHGLLLPCVAGADAFRALRDVVLGGAATREELPHLTLAHPRNPRAPGDRLAATAALPAPLEVRFAVIHWIEQVPGRPWTIRDTFPLGTPHLPDGGKGSACA